MTMSSGRIALFVIGCLGARVGLVLFARRYPQLLAFPALAIATGFALIYLNGWRQTGLETFNERIWWNAWRPVHASLYLLFAVYALGPYKDQAWVALAADVLIGATLYLRRNTY